MNLINIHNYPPYMLELPKVNHIQPPRPAVLFV